MDGVELIWDSWDHIGLKQPQNCKLNFKEKMVLISNSNFYFVNNYFFSDLLPWNEISICTENKSTTGRSIKICLETPCIGKRLILGKFPIILFRKIEKIISFVMQIGWKMTRHWKIDNLNSDYHLESIFWNILDSSPLSKEIWSKQYFWDSFYFCGLSLYEIKHFQIAWISKLIDRFFITFRINQPT